MTYLLLAEKPSAANNFAKALGGMTGTFNGKPYKVQTLYGHMLEFVEPHEMVRGDEAKERFKLWTGNAMPWDPKELTWKKQAQVTTNAVGKKSSKAKAIADVAAAAKGVSAIVIATDKDPSGEGQLIGWEVIQAIGWKGPVKRLYFIDESEKELQKGFTNIQDLPSYDKDGEYVKANLRSRWDYLSLQLTRLSTDAARIHGYRVVVRQGRLKSVMTKLVADQINLVKAYKKKPFYEVKYKDDKDNVYSRVFDEDRDRFRFASKGEAEADARKYGPSKVVQDSVTKKETAPGKLLDLGGLASILGAQGFKPKEVLATYQKMYEAKIVSYPRTEDKFISVEQFKEMLPLVPKIAAVVGADMKHLTYRSMRKTHVKDGGAHGANRPGLKVPSALKDLKDYGPSAMAIYETLAKNFLAMFGENYVYNSIKGHIERYPEFTTIINVPISLGFKAIFDADKETADDDKGNDPVSSGLGRSANQFVFEGVNKKPPHPTHKWLEKQLSRYEVGTGATRVSTLSEVTTGKTALLTDSRGKLNLTTIGEIAAVMLEGSLIGDPAVTEKLFKAMKDAGQFKVTPETVLHTATQLIKHDKEVFYRNAQKLHSKVGEPEPIVEKEKVDGLYVPTGEKISFNKEWNGYVFSDQEVQKLLQGEVITIEGKNPTSGVPFRNEGKLDKSKFKGHTFWGFKRLDADAYTAKTAPFPTEWSGHKFTSEEQVRLRAGEKIKIKAISKSKKTYEVEITFEVEKYKGTSSWKIKPHFEERANYAKPKSTRKSRS
ncbi:hypothetical protein ASD24_24765 [Paenibacillus sp. Root52]|uniref:DNA topoisomerase n=1 Tax=Paenibacillus sp. Root52 TaxID=1736552 RepID=UPI0006FE607E|nr:DNA topoisomerase [Paenibacillus sp. Root52]KQY91011.1 hypothetical protein ASD24_24765 [Paenibacillus sp. Root52]